MLIINEPEAVSTKSSRALLYKCGMVVKLERIQDLHTQRCSYIVHMIGILVKHFSCVCISFRTQTSQPNSTSSLVIRAVMFILSLIPRLLCGAWE